jgi:hypothetical protein
VGPSPLGEIDAFRKVDEHHLEGSGGV